LIFQILAFSTEYVQQLVSVYKLPVPYNAVFRFQYFGNLVTCRSWEHLWLNEGLATFYEVRAMTVLAPTLFHVST